MTQPATASRPPQLSSEDTMKWVVILILVFAALVAAMITRRVVSPIDAFAAQEVCTAHGNEIGRELISAERSNRFAVVNRSEGSCLFAPTEGGDGELLVPLPEAQPGSVYDAVKVMTFVLQLGAASLTVRILADPLLDRFVRDPEP